MQNNREYDKDENEEHETPIEYRKIQKEDERHNISKLIHMTDADIYGDLFGKGANAFVIISLLIDNIKSVFHHGNYMIAIHGNRAVGIIFYKCEMKWDKEVIRETFKELGADIPDGFEAVSDYLDKSFEKKRINLRSVSVDEDYRQRGIGRMLVNKAMDISEDKEFSLIVLKTNIYAIGMYEKCGFRIDKECFEYGGYGKENVCCYRMSKKYGDRWFEPVTFQPSSSVQNRTLRYYQHHSD